MLLYKSFEFFSRTAPQSHRLVAPEYICIISSINIWNRFRYHTLKRKRMLRGTFHSFSKSSSPSYVNISIIDRKIYQSWTACRGYNGGENKDINRNSYNFIALVGSKKAKSLFPLIHLVVIKINRSPGGAGNESD